MPELPEVEVVRRDLEREVVGKKIKGVDVDGMRSIRRYRQRKQFTGELDGRKITAVTRRGKYLVVKLDDGNALIIHLGMSGQLLRAKSSRETVPKHTHVTITFTQGGQLRFVDPRTFGEMFVTPYDGIEDAVEELAHLGIDPLESAMSWDYFGELVSQRHLKLKAALMDQKFLAGIGNIYSDEILFNAGLRWDRMSDSLSPEEIRRLYRGARRDAPGRGEVPGLVARRRAVRRPLRQEGRVPEPPQGLRPRGPGLPALPTRHRPPEDRRPQHLLLLGLPGLTDWSSCPGPPPGRDPGIRR